MGAPPSPVEPPCPVSGSQANAFSGGFGLIPWPGSPAPGPYPGFPDLGQAILLTLSFLLSADWDCREGPSLE